MVFTFGFVFIVGDKRIVLSPTEAARKLADKLDKEATDAQGKALAARKNIEENGIELELPPGMEIPLAGASGTVIEFLKIFDKDVTLPNLKNLPLIGDAIVELNKMQVTITELSIRIPGTKSKNKNKTVRVGIYVTPSAPIDIKLLQVEGVSLSFQHEF
jgi:hypothetical protein